MAKIIVNNENKKSTIAPEIYGHFSEHLGRCIYYYTYFLKKVNMIFQATTQGSFLGLVRI